MMTGKTESTSKVKVDTDTALKRTVAILLIVVLVAFILHLLGLLPDFSKSDNVGFGGAPTEQQYGGEQPTEQIPAPMHSKAKPIADPACAMLDDNSGMRMQQKPAPNAVRVRNPVTGRCSWYVPD